LLLAKRRELGWTQKVAARNLGVDPCTWSSWEYGGTIMMRKHRRVVASFLGAAEEIVNEIMGKI
jgi:transcriptional regulator with XRE-family HTH domain